MPAPPAYQVRNQWTYSLVGGGGSPANCFGTASELKIEGLEREVDSDRRPGAAGAIHYGGDFNPITATITLSSITDSLRSAVLESVCSNIVLAASAVFENARDACDIATYTVSMRGIVTKYPIGWQLSNELAKNELVIGVNSFSETWKGKQFTYDPDDLIWNWNGTNLWAARRTALGM